MKPYRWLVAMLVLAVVGVVGAQWLAQHDPSRLGQVIVRSGGWDYSTTVPRALLLLVLAWLALGFLWSMLRLPFRAWSRYRKRQGRARLLEGLRALQAGHWQRAERLLATTAEDAQSGAIALAAAVRAADGRGDPAAAQRWLTALAPRDPTAHALLLGERLLEAGQPRQAIEALDVAAAQPLPPRGLLLREDHEVRRVVLPLWGGDGTRGITLYLRTEARWARFPPAQLPVFRPIDFQTLPVPKLLTEQEREAATVANDMPSNIR